MTCNRGWLEYLDRAAWSALEPILLGTAPGTVHIIDPADQATLAAWAVKVSLLDAGLAVPESSLVHATSWLPSMDGRSQDVGRTRVCSSGLPHRCPGRPCRALWDILGRQRPVPGVLLRAEGRWLSLDNEIWLESKGLYVSALLQIAPAVAAVRWPSEVVFTVDDLKLLARRLQQGLPSRA